MSEADNSLIFICSFCEQTMKITPQHVGKRIGCPKCSRKILVYPNRNLDIQRHLSATWHYRRPKLLLGTEEVGPITDEQFVAEVRSGRIASNTEIKSAQATGDQWVVAERIAVAEVQDRIEQLHAEQHRVQTKKERRRERDAQNFQILYRGIATAVSDGQLTNHERDQLTKFARAAGIPEHQLEQLIREHSDKLIQSVINEAVEDGILDPREKQAISQLASGLGVQISLTDHQSRRLRACELAWQLANGSFLPGSITADDISLSSNETLLARAKVKWFEIVQLKKPVGIRLDDQHCLKQVGAGGCVLTNKRLTLVGEFAAKKSTLSSIAQVRRFRDGVFCNRSTGKSVFLQPTKVDEGWEEFSLLLEHTVTQQPVLGIEPPDNFVPDNSFVTPYDVTVEREALSYFSPLESTEPRYTFRVVGDHIGDRSYRIESLRVGDPLQVVREPSNAYDSNAIAVYDLNQYQLGYLKREVASWFAPMLDRGRTYRSQAFRKPSSGGLIVGMFE